MIAQPPRRIQCLAVVLLAAGLLSACGGTPTVPAVRDLRTEPGARASGGHTLSERAVTIAMQQLGVPYRYGGSSPSGFDCSGLVHYSYRLAGRAVPRTTRRLWADTDVVDRSDLVAGDLLFFSIKGKMQHVGLYIGDDKFIHAPSTGRRVSVASLRAGYYDDAFLRGGRIR